MNIAIIGTGYVGLVTGTCLANLGNNVICIDIDKNKIDSLKNGVMPIYEPGLKEMVERNAKEKRISFTTSLKEGMGSADIIFIAVGTPQGKDGSADLQYVFKVAEDIGKEIDSYKVIVDKSTVPVGTAEKVKAIISKNLKKPVPFDVVSNPEFLREGKAIKDFLSPDRVVVGVESEKAKSAMAKLYRPLERTGRPVFFTGIKSAEMIKYASNAFLAAKISFINELSHFAEKMGADIKVVAAGMGMDERIGPRFLQAGIGYGGSCFPKDVQALMRSMKDNSCPALILGAVEEVNERQKLSLIQKIRDALGSLEGKKIAVWGLAFKPDTDDMREAPSLVIIPKLQEQGAKIAAFDPAAMEEAKKHFSGIAYGNDPYGVLEGADALVILTEWDEFRELDLEKVKSSLKSPNVIDGRNMYDPKEMKAMGFVYRSIGR
ncbi:UDP-glucose/GDP-mannose dehydrogenase family protein [Candidatus Woesearchaeota archaeon]|nr:UDP-glucose/GDP-mannose dehydrogenase family protein [Candidatus Woesearchaeota archaeon]